MHASPWCVAPAWAIAHDHHHLWLEYVDFPLTRHERQLPHRIHGQSLAQSKCSRCNNRSFVFYFVIFCCFSMMSEFVQLLVFCDDWKKQTHKQHSSREKRPTLWVCRKIKIQISAIVAFSFSLPIIIIFALLYLHSNLLLALFFFLVTHKVYSLHKRAARSRESKRENSITRSQLEQFPFFKKIKTFAAEF